MFVRDECNFGKRRLFRVWNCVIAAMGLSDNVQIRNYGADLIRIDPIFIDLQLLWYLSEHKLPYNWIHVWKAPLFRVLIFLHLFHYETRRVINYAVSRKFPEPEAVYYIPGITSGGINNSSNANFLTNPSGPKDPSIIISDRCDLFIAP